MIRSDDLIAIGIQTHLQTDGEVVTVCEKKVVAIVNRSPQTLLMMNAGYFDKEPITIEVQKGIPSSLFSVFIRGVSHPGDLRGNIPYVNKFAIIGDKKRKIDSIEDQGNNWLITTVKLNSTQARSE